MGDAGSKPVRNASSGRSFAGLRKVPVMRGPCQAYPRQLLVGHKAPEIPAAMHTCSDNLFLAT